MRVCARVCFCVCVCVCVCAATEHARLCVHSLRGLSLVREERSGWITTWRPPSVGRCEPGECFHVFCVCVCVCM